jgi:hypothetical protein
MKYNKLNKYMHHYNINYIILLINQNDDDVIILDDIFLNLILTDTFSSIT